MNRNRMMALLAMIAILLSMAAPCAASMADESAMPEVAVEDSAPTPVPTPRSAPPAGEAAPAVAPVDVLQPTSKASEDGPTEPSGESAEPQAEPAGGEQADQEAEPSGEGEQADGDSGAVAPPIVAPVEIPTGPAITPPPELPGAPKPQADEVPAIVTKDATAMFEVTFIYMSELGVEQTLKVTVASGGSATAPEVPQTYSLEGGRTYHFKGWDSSFNNVTTNLTVRAKYVEATTLVPSIDPYYLDNYSGKPDKTVTMELPVMVVNATSATAPVFSNALIDGTQQSRYNEKITPNQYDQSLFTSLNIQSMKFAIDTTSLSSMPFTSDSVMAANAKRVKAYVVQQFTDEPSYYSQYGFLGGSINRGFATFDLKVKSSATNGTYAIPLLCTWTDDEGPHELTFDAYIQITGEKTGGGGSSGGSSGGSGVSPTDKPVPKARLFIEDVVTDPPEPKAGDSFDIVMSLVNTSKTLYLQNLMLTYTVSDDLLLPAGEQTNVLYIPKINASAKYELRIPVVSQPEIPSKLVKMDVAVEYEDKKLATESAQQTLVIPVLPIQRMKVDELKLPTGTHYVDQEYEIEVGVANFGKTILHNLTATVVSDDPNLLPGSTWNGGNVEAGASKTISLSPMPMAPGEYKATVEISYENDQGDKTSERKDFTFTAAEEEDYNYGDSDFDYTPPPEPEQITPMQIMSVLPPWLYASAGALVLLIIVSMSVSARKRRKRAMEDDEMD